MGNIGAQRLYRIAIGIVAFIGLYQGAVPLAARGLFSWDQRFAPAQGLPPPWWWLACLAIATAAIVLVAAIEAARRGRISTGALPGRGDAPTADRPAARGNPYDILSGLVFLVGLYNGVAPSSPGWSSTGSCCSPCPYGCRRHGGGSPRSPSSQ